MTDPDLKEHVIDALRLSPRDAASDGTIQGILKNDGRDVSRGTVRQACAELVDTGRLEIVDEKGQSRRYKLVAGSEDDAHR